MIRLRLAAFGHRRGVAVVDPVDRSHAGQAQGLAFGEATFDHNSSATVTSRSTRSPIGISTVSTSTGRIGNPSRCVPVIAWLPMATRYAVDPALIICSRNRPPRGAVRVTGSDSARCA